MRWIALAEKSTRPGWLLAQSSTLFSREISAYFLSPMSYVVWGVFLIVSGYLFATGLRDGQTASMSGAFNQMGMLLIFVTPLTTMHLIAEEKRLGTLEILLSDPTSEACIIAAKFMASYAFLLVVLLPTLAYPLVLGIAGQPDPGPIAAGYLGLALLTGLFASVGLLASALLDSQFAAGAISFTVLLLFWGMGLAAEAVGPGTTRDVFSYLSAFNHYNSFLRGVVDTRTVIYYVSLISANLLLAANLLHMRRLK